MDKNENKENKVEEKTEEKNNKKMNKKYLIGLIVIGCIALLALIFSTIFALVNVNNKNIVSGVKIQGIDVSGLSSEEAKSKIELVYQDRKEKDIELKYEDFSTKINPDIIGVNYDIEKVVGDAVLIGKNSNIFSNNFEILAALMGKKDLNIDITINEEELQRAMEETSKSIPGAIKESDYYVDEDKLIITRGKEGLKVNTEELSKTIKEYLRKTSVENEIINISVVKEKPKDIDIDKIHEEVHKDVQDAYYTKNPFEVHPEVEGVDFDLEAARNLLQQEQEQYEIQLVITKPKITIAQIGSEAFPDQLSNFTTIYDASNADRTTNLRLACQKINDKVVMPGETFSYNKTLGARTVESGYKNAKIYSQGEVVDGIGGGICQISSTLYNAVLMANMEIVERRNHQFVTSYLPAGRDATVVYGAADFRFKNTREYPVRIRASVSNGVASVSIYGIKSKEEYKVTFSTRTISSIPFTIKYEDDSTLPAGQEEIKQKGANGLVTETYITKTLNGSVVSTKLLSRDTYTPMQRIIRRGTGAQAPTPAPTPEPAPVTVPEQKTNTEEKTEPKQDPKQKEQTNDKDDTTNGKTSKTGV